MRSQSEAERLVAQAMSGSPEERTAAIEEISNELELPAADIVKLLQRRDDATYIIERLRLSQRGSLVKSRDELLVIIAKLIAGDGNEAQTDEWLRVIAANVPMPYPLLTGLIFHPETTATPESVLDLALAYEPRVFQL